MTLPTDRDARNAIPIWDGVINYFPDVWAEIAKVSVLGNVQHNLGTKLHFNRDVSTDHLNKVFRHALDHEGGNVFDDGGKTRHLAKAAWRILAALQVSIENERDKCKSEEMEIKPGPVYMTEKDDGKIHGMRCAVLRGMLATWLGISSAFTAGRVPTNTRDEAVSA